MGKRQSALENLEMSEMRQGPSFAGIYEGQDVFVTGHTGFKGAWLSLWLNRLGARVYGYSLPPPTNPSLFDLAKLSELVDHTLGDIRDLNSLRAALYRARPRFVFHLAAQPIVSHSYKDPVETLSTNVMGTTMVLEALRAVDWPCAVVLITSDKCYDNVEWPWGYRETDPLGGKDIYSGSKGAAELAIKSYFHSFFQREGHPVRLAIGRAGNVIGGGDWAQDRIVVDCVKAWLVAQKVPIRSPAATRPWQHVLEPLSGYLALGQALVDDSTLSGEAFNFGPRAEQSRTVVDLLTDLGEIYGLSTNQQGYDIVDQVPFYEASLLKLNCDKALLSMHWTPTLDYSSVVRMTGEWYRMVLNEGMDAQLLTQQQIAEYEDRAMARQLRWRVGN